MNQLLPSEGITLVIGGTGKTGRRIAERLLALGRKTRIASRSATPSFDWNDQSTWDNALAGVTTAYITYAPDLAIPGATAAIRAFVSLAVERGVRRMVLLSGRGEEEAQACERIVQKADVDWTIVRASWFDQNFSEGEFLGMVRNGAITLPAADVPEPFIDVEDIADLPGIKTERLQHYFSTYKMQPGKEANIKVDCVYGREEALKVIAAAEKDYWHHFGELNDEEKL